MIKRRTKRKENTSHPFNQNLMLKTASLWIQMKVCLGWTEAASTSFLRGSMSQPGETKIQALFHDPGHLSEPRTNHMFTGKTSWMCRAPEMREWDTNIRRIHQAHWHRQRDPGQGLIPFQVEVQPSAITKPRGLGVAHPSTRWNWSQSLDKDSKLLETGPIRILTTKMKIHRNWRKATTTSWGSTHWEWEALSNRRLQTTLSSTICNMMLLPRALRIHTPLSSPHIWDEVLWQEQLQKIDPKKDQNPTGKEETRNSTRSSNQLNMK